MIKFPFQPIWLGLGALFEILKFQVRLFVSFGRLIMSYILALNQVLASES